MGERFKRRRIPLARVNIAPDKHIGALVSWLRPSRIVAGYMLASVAGVVQRSEHAVSTRLIYAMILSRVLSRLTIAEKERLFFTIIINLGMADLAPAAYIIDSVTQNADGTVMIIGKKRASVQLTT
jgi:hypothetical protein